MCKLAKVRYGGLRVEKADFFVARCTSAITITSVSHDTMASIIHGSNDDDSNTPPRLMIPIQIPSVLFTLCSISPLLFLSVSTAQYVPDSPKYTFVQHMYFSSTGVPGLILLSHQYKSQSHDPHCADKISQSEPRGYVNFVINYIISNEETWMEDHKHHPA